MQTFSQRHGHKPVRTQLQFESMDDELRNSLWNCLWEHFFNDRKVPSHGSSYFPDYIRFLIESVYETLLRWPLDKINWDWSVELKHLRQKYFEWEWFNIYDFVEFIMNSSFDENYMDNYYSEKNWIIQNKLLFVDSIGNILKREAAAYTVLKAGEEYHITPITNESEVEAIESAIQDSADLGLNNVSTHIQTALSHLSDRTNRDYPSSIAQSILAVEYICKLVVDDSNATLGKSLSKLRNSIHIEISNEIVTSMEKLYVYSNEVSRHSKKPNKNGEKAGNETVLCLEDAKYSLVHCSAFINYLIVKAGKAGIDLSN